MNQEVEVILQANEDYYQAFAVGNYQGMDEVWASDHEISIIHPGWSPLHGREDVMNSWRSILSGQGESLIKCRNAVAYIMGEAALVICTEHLPEVELVASNFFVRENGGWKMVHHQAGPVAQQEIDFPVSGSVH